MPTQVDTEPKQIGLAGALLKQFQFPPVAEDIVVLATMEQIAKFCDGTKAARIGNTLLME